jgi:hypothetical protein
VVGRVLLDQEQTFIPYDFSSAGVGFTASATELGDGRIAFLGSPGPDGPFRLFIMSVGGATVPVSGEISGRILSWEWNRSRTALLLLVDNGGTRQLWVIRTNGSIQNATPSGGAPSIAQW